MFTLGSPKVILRLHIDPSFRTSAQPFTEPDGHSSTYSSFAIEHTRERDARHAQRRCGIGHRDQTIREDPILEHLSRMWGIVHSRHSQLLGDGIEWRGLSLCRSGNDLKSLANDVGL